MKAKISVLVLSVLIAHASMAQFHIGFKGGANITKINGVSFQDQFRYGYHLGGFANIGFGRTLSLQPEVLFSQYRTTVDSSFHDIYKDIWSNPQATVKLNYLTIPILLDYKFLGPLHLQVGPQFGILMNHDKTLLQNGKNAFKSGDFAMVGGASINILKVRLTGRYIVGLNNINDIGNQDQWKSQAVQLSIGFAL